MAFALLNSVSMLPTDCFEFRRRIDGVIYRFEPVDPKGGYPSRKRVDSDLWLAWIREKVGASLTRAEPQIVGLGMLSWPTKGVCRPRVNG